MNTKQFIANIENTYKRCVETVKIKNQDYAGDEDPWNNFRLAELIKIDVERAILLRISDKIARISNLIDKEPAVVDEKMEDTIEDCINYLAILKAYRENEKNNN
jgi:hypothetical protein